MTLFQSGGLGEHPRLEQLSPAVIRESSITLNRFLRLWRAVAICLNSLFTTIFNGD
jgi:hypothetical protein